METRLKLAGATRSIFTEDTYPLFWEYSDHGVPRLINKIAKLSLKAGETYGLERIDAQVVYQVGRQFEKTTGSAASRGKSKKKKEEQVFIEANEPLIDQRLSDPVMEGKGGEESTRPVSESPEFLTEPTGIFRPEPSKGFEIEAVTNQSFSAESASEGVQESLPKGGGLSDSIQSLALPIPRSDEEGDISLPFGMEKIEETFFPESDQGLRSIPEGEPFGLATEDLNSAETPDETHSQSHWPEIPESSPPAPERIFGEIQVGKFKVRLHLPPQFVEQALSANQEDRVKMADEAAIQALKKFSQLTSTPLPDPFSTWTELRSIILKGLAPSENEMAA
jgi:hypothetical protein